MDNQRILEELLVLLEANGVTIRLEPLDGRAGGLCAVKNQKIFFVDTQAGSVEKIAACAEAVAKLIDAEKIYIKPQIRQLLEKYRQKNKS